MWAELRQGRCLVGNLASLLGDPVWLVSLVGAGNDNSHEVVLCSTQRSESGHGDAEGQPPLQQVVPFVFVRPRMPMPIRRRTAGDAGGSWPYKSELQELGTLYSREIVIRNHRQHSFAGWSLVNGEAFHVIDFKT